MSSPVITWLSRQSASTYREVLFVGGGQSYPIMEFCWVIDDRYVFPTPHFKTYIVLPCDPDWVAKVTRSASMM